MGKLVDLTGQRFGRLTVLCRAGTQAPGKHTTWLCQCDCGKRTVVSAVNLNSGRQKSCGCLRNEKSLARIVNYNKEHQSTRQKRIFKIWIGMRNRCYRENCEAYAWYGGRGIRICEEWADYETFERWALSSGYGPNLTIDRIDVNGDYTPENCRWVTRKVQAYNRRDNRRLTFQGETLTITEWAERIGCTPTCIYYRLNAGWSLEETLTTRSRSVRHKNK